MCSFLLFVFVSCCCFFFATVLLIAERYGRSKFVTLLSLAIANGRSCSIGSQPLCDEPSLNMLVYTILSYAIANGRSCLLASRKPHFTRSFMSSTSAKVVHTPRTQPYCHRYISSLFFLQLSLYLESMRPQGRRRVSAGGPWWCSGFLVKNRWCKVMLLFVSTRCAGRDGSGKE